ncbi:MAG: carbohydrate-binding domain-containing protein [Paludibacteraceae bacterium]|nr:carbohydrate-binding domain-containing protein [Paludibacteraceae bacterium]
MKKYLMLLAAGSFAALLFAESKMDFHLLGGLTESFGISVIDTIRFHDGVMSVEGPDKQYAVADVDSATFSFDQTAVAGDTVFITYNGNSVVVDNPYSSVVANVSDADVVISSQEGKKGIVYYLTGSSSNGSFTLTPDHGFTLCLDNLDLTSASSAPVCLNKGADGESYAATIHLRGNSHLADAAGSPLKGAVYSKSKLKISADSLYTGASISVKGNAKHAVNCAKRVELYSGKLNIDGAAGDGINADGVEVYGGELLVSGTVGDGVDCSEVVRIAGGTVNVDSDADDTKAIKCDSLVAVSGGNVSVSVSGAGSKGLKAGQLVAISGGTFTASLSAVAPYVNTDDDTDYGYNTAVTSNGDIIVSDSAIVVVKGNGIAAKALSADGSIEVTGGSVEAELTGYYYKETANADTASVCGLKADADVRITNGVVSIITGDSSNVSKGIKGDYVYIAGGDITINNKGGYWYTSSTSSSSSQGGGRFGGGPGGFGNSSSTTVNSSTPKCIRGDKLVSITGGVTKLTCAHGKGITSDEAVVIGNEKGNDDDLSLVVMAGTSSDATYVKGGENSRTKYCAGPKAINCDKTIDIYSGTIEAKVFDTGIKGRDVTINGGKITIDASMDQGIHGLNSLTVNDGDIYVSNSYEALEAITLTMNGGITSIYASNDGWNASVSSSGLSGTPSITINGGYHYLNVGSGDTDCLDSNGGMTFTGGVLIVEGGSTLDGGDGGNYSFTYKGGKLMLFGSGVENSPSGATTTSGAAGSANTLYTAANNGVVLSSFTTTKASNNLYFLYDSSASLTSGGTLTNVTKTVNFRWTGNSTLTYSEGGTIANGTVLGTASSSSGPGGFGGGSGGNW